MIQFAHVHGLTNTERRHLRGIFIEAFNGKPWYESWDDLTAKEYLNPLIESVGVGIIRVSGVIAGFTISLPLGEHNDHAQMVELGAHAHDFYIAEVVVCQNFRGQGIAKVLVEHTIEFAKERHDYITLRTRDDHVRMIRIMENLGFNTIANYNAQSGGKESGRVLFRRQA